MSKTKPTETKEETKAVATTGNSALPAYLQGQQKTAKIGNTDTSDFIIPRVKLLQAISPEVMEGIAGAKMGEFWHTIAGQSLGPSITGIPIILKKTYVLWAPRGDDRGILARADDGLNWDLPGAEFTVKPKNSAHNVTYKLGRTVHERTGDGPALSEFGSSVPGDPKSAPAAALTYQMIWYFPDFPDLSPAIIINTRSSVKPGQLLLSKIDLRPVDHYYQKYNIGVRKEGQGADVYFNYVYEADGFADEETAVITKGLFERFSTEKWRANEETADVDSAEAGNGERPRRSNGPADSKAF